MNSEEINLKQIKEIYYKKIFIVEKFKINIFYDNSDFKYYKDIYFNRFNKYFDIKSIYELLSNSYYWNRFLCSDVNLDKIASKDNISKYYLIYNYKNRVWVNPFLVLEFIKYLDNEALMKEYPYYDYIKNKFLKIFFDKNNKIRKKFYKLKYSKNKYYNNKFITEQELQNVFEVDEDQFNYFLSVFGMKKVFINETGDNLTYIWNTGYLSSDFLRFVKDEVLINPCLINSIMLEKIKYDLNIC